MSANSKGRTVVICGSMKNLDLMSKIGELLESTGLNVITPAADEPTEPWTVEGSVAVKREASKRHMGHIRHGQTVAVLVVNVDRPNANNYVGPNSFAEIGVAFSDDRPVFLLQGMPDCYADELQAWDVKCLHGDLRGLVDAAGGSSDIDWTPWREVFQFSVA